MHLFEITRTEEDPDYQELHAANVSRQYSFLNSVVKAAVAKQRLFLSSTVLKALNYHAIACLHISCGEYRPCGVSIGDHEPPQHFQVQALMDDFINHVNSQLAYNTDDPVKLATYVLWRLNYIHPFINGNGRTARAACYFVLCLYAGGPIPGAHILPELIMRERAAYCAALREADLSFDAGNEPDLEGLYSLLVRLLNEQISSAGNTVDV